MPSDNSTAVRGLIGTLNREIKKEVLYNILDKIHTDLNSVYEALFVGPLPAVSGINLTNLDASDVTVGVLPDIFDLAYVTKSNSFRRGQIIVFNDDEEPLIKIGFGNLDPTAPVDPTSYFRIGSLADGEFFLSQNVKWTGAAWARDNGGIGALKTNLIGGELNLYWYDSGLAGFRNTFKISGKKILIANDADNAYLSVVATASTNMIRLADDASTDNSVTGHIGIPVRTSAQMPTAAANAAGLIVLESTNNRICFYIGANRYYVNGTAF